MTLLVDGDRRGEGRVEQTVPVGFSIDETSDIGRDAGAPVSPDYAAHENRFSGEVNWVHIDLRGDDHDREISAHERFRAAMVWE